MNLEPLGRRGIYVLVLLLSVNVLNLVDRQRPYILIDSIRAEPQLTDAQRGLMAGLAFAMVYSVGLLVFAEVGDRFGYRRVLAGAVIFWSAATALAGGANTFGHLIASRAGVAAGEAGAVPVGHALIAQAFPSRHRATLIAVFSLGIPLGVMVGLVLGGFLALLQVLTLLWYAPVSETGQLLAPEDMRATSAAIWLFVLALVGASIGPFAIGWASDQLTTRLGQQALRYAMCLLVVPLAWASMHFCWAARALPRDLEGLP